MFSFTILLFKEEVCSDIYRKVIFYDIQVSLLNSYPWYWKLNISIFWLRLIWICFAEEAKDVKDSAIAAIFYHKYQDKYHYKKKLFSRLIFWVVGGFSCWLTKVFTISGLMRINQHIPVQEKVCLICVNSLIFGEILWLQLKSVLP